MQDIDEMHSLTWELFHAESGKALDFQIIDGRAKERYESQIDEPWPETRKGNIINSLNMPFNVNLNADGTFKSQG